jgi:hypothetical protein
LLFLFSYTYEDFKAYKTIKECWDLHDSTDFTSRLVIAFTFPAEKSIDRMLRDASLDLKDVLRDANDRYIVFSSQHADKSVQHLVKMVDDMSKYTYCRHEPEAYVALASRRSQVRIPAVAVN